MEQIFYNHDKTQSVTIPDLSKYDVINLAMSGGADSALLAYLFAKQIVDDNLKAVIIPVTRVRPYPAIAPRNWNVWRTAAIMSKITLLLGKDVFQEHQIEHPVQQTKMNAEEEKAYNLEIWLRLEKKFKFDQKKEWAYFNGVSKNPSDDEMKDNRMYNDDRCKDRDQNQAVPHPLRPLGMIDKKFLAEIYQQLGIIDTLFPLTYSCEGDHEITKNYMLHCDNCWWCHERFWAFGRYI